MSTATTVIRKRALLALAVALVANCNAPDVTAPSPDDHVRGPAGAKVTLIEYGDYPCPPCVASSAAVEQLLTSHPRDVRFIYRHHPGRKRPNALAAANAAEAAELQGKFWEMHRALYEGQREWYGARSPEEVFRRYAQNLRLDLPRFDAALQAPDADRRMREIYQAGRNVGVRGVPAFFLNGERLVPPPMTYDDLERRVTAALRKAE